MSNSTVSSTSCRDFQCDLCGYSSEKKTNLRRHRQAMHQAVDTLLCCGIRFPDKASYREHTRTCHRLGHSCTLCPRTFNRRALLRRHSAVHTGLREFRCSLCSYASSHKSNLERHFRIHWRSSEGHRQLPDSTTQVPEAREIENQSILEGLLQEPEERSTFKGPRTISHSIEAILSRPEVRRDEGVVAKFEGHSEPVPNDQNQIGGGHPRVLPFFGAFPGFFQSWPPQL